MLTETNRSASRIQNMDGYSCPRGSCKQKGGHSSQAAETLADRVRLRWTGEHWTGQPPKRVSRFSLHDSKRRWTHGSEAKFPDRELRSGRDRPLGLGHSGNRLPRRVRESCEALLATEKPIAHHRQLLTLPRPSPLAKPQLGSTT